MLTCPHRSWDAGSSKVAHRAPPWRNRVPFLRVHGSVGEHTKDLRFRRSFELYSPAASDIAFGSDIRLTTSGIATQFYSPAASGIAFGSDIRLTPSGITTQFYSPTASYIALQ